ncbi:MAG: fatty acid desaturase [Planctomycetaceae bacterium]|jgi:fatty acid desaturase
MRDFVWPSRAPIFSRRPAPPGPHRRNRPQSDFRRVRPQWFLIKLMVLLGLLLVCSYGVLSTTPAMKFACASLLAAAPLSCAAESWAKHSRRQSLAYLLLALLGLWFCRLAPTFACQFGIGVMLAHGTQLAHQALHKSGTGRKAFDTPIGLLLCGVTGVSFHYYRWSHLRHHKHNGTERDRESFAYGYSLLESPSRWRRCLGLLLHLSMAAHYAVVARRVGLAMSGRLAKNLLRQHPDMPRQTAYDIESETRWQVGLLLVVLVASIVIPHDLLIRLWLVPMLFGWGPAQSLIESTEHWHCDLPSSNVFLNTRSLLAGRFAQWITNYNNCHVGHHHDMSVPVEMLPAFERLISQTNPLRHWEDSYPAFYRRFLRHVWYGPVADRVR